MNLKSFFLKITNLIFVIVLLFSLNVFGAQAHYFSYSANGPKGRISGKAGPYKSLPECKAAMNKFMSAWSGAKPSVKYLGNFSHDKKK